MRNRSERLDALEALAKKCLDEITAIPTEEFIEELREMQISMDKGGHPGPPAIIARSVAITKYIGTATTALKEMGSIVRKEFDKTDDLEEVIKKETNIKTLEGFAKQLTQNASKDGRPTPA